MSEFKCDKCDKVFELEASLHQHVKDKHEEKPAEEHTHGSSAHPHHAEHPAHHAPLHHPDKVKVKVNVSRKTMYAILGIVILGAAGYGAYAYFSSLPAPVQSGGTASTVNAPIGALGSIHTHADFAVYLDGEKITPLGPSYYVRNAFVHVESGPGDGNVIHMHATNVPLGFFFRSVGMSFNSNCFRLDNGKDYCSDGNKTLRMFVRHEGGEWQENRQFHTYVFQDLDKVLITYGDEAEEGLRAQMDSVTDFSRSNSDGVMDLSNLPR